MEQDALVAVVGFLLADEFQGVAQRLDRRFERRLDVAALELQAVDLALDVLETRLGLFEQEIRTALRLADDPLRFLLSLRADSSLNIVDATPVVLTVAAPIPCSYSVNPVSTSATAGGGSGSFDVSAGSNCNWTALASDPAWITLTGNTSGTGSGSVSYVIGPNAGATERKTNGVTSRTRSSRAPRILRSSASR